MTAAQLLVPKTSDSFIKALDLVNAERWPLDTDIIRRSKNPWTCPEHLLPYLARELSVDLWDDAWSTAKKRAVIARAVGLARIKGTEAGLAEAIAIMGGKLLSVIAPPSTLFLSITRTDAERAAWLARLPQLRIYPRRMPAPFAGFFIGQYLSDAFTTASTAEFQATPRTTLWRKGVETDLITLDRRRGDPTVSNVEELIEARERRPFAGFYCGRALTGAHLVSSTAASQVYSLRTRNALQIPGRDTMAIDVAQPALTPIDVRAEEVREPRALRTAWVGGSWNVGAMRFLRNSAAREQIFKRVHLNDPDVAPTLGAPAQRAYLGINFRFGMPAFHAELKVKVEQKRPPAAFAPFTYGYWLKPDTSAFDKVVEAVRTHQSRRDRILINTRTKAVVTAGVNAVAGPGLTAGMLVDV